MNQKRMNMEGNFVYDVPVKVYFGENKLGHLSEELRRFGTRVLLTYGGSSTIDATKFMAAGACGT
jgi:alcohol dehydrogenase YqhD (iron-dependent ADH family)